MEERIEIPAGISVKQEGQSLVVKGREGELKRVFPGVAVACSAGEVTLTTRRASKREKKMLMSAKAHMKNMLLGVQQKHSYTLKICSGHFPMSVAVAKGELVVKNFFGEKVPRVLKLRQGAEVKVEGDHITVVSADKEVAGQVAASIQQLTRRPNFDLRIFQDGIYITEKSGKRI
jgi:large subunit ribosomal protein L6